MNDERKLANKLRHRTNALSNRYRLRRQSRYQGGSRAILLSAKERSIPFIISTGLPLGGNQQLEKVLEWSARSQRERRLGKNVCWSGDDPSTLFSGDASFNFNQPVTLDLLINNQYQVLVGATASAHSASNLNKERNVYMYVDPIIRFD